MSKRFLNKNIKCFLEESLPEKIFLKSNSRKKLKESGGVRRSASKKGLKNTIQKEISTLLEEDFLVKGKEGVIYDRFLYDNSLKESESESGIRSNRLRNQSLSKKDRLGKVEAQIIEEFLSKCVTGEKKKETSRLFDNITSNQESFSFPFSLVGEFNLTSSQRPNILMSIEEIRKILFFKRTQSYTYSEYKSQLREAKKIRFLYGDISKRELKRTIQKGKQLYGIPGDNLLILLESRLDVILERCGFFSSIKGSRQSITHGRIKVNSRKVTFPGYQLKAGDLIKIEPRSRAFRAFIEHNKNFIANQPHLPDLPFSNKEISFRNKNKKVYSSWFFSVFPSILNSLIVAQSSVIEGNAKNLSTSPSTSTPFFDITKEKLDSRVTGKKGCVNSYQQDQVFNFSGFSGLENQSATDCTSRVPNSFDVKKEVVLFKGTLLEKLIENCGLMLGFNGLSHFNLTKKYKKNYTFFSPHTQTAKYNWIGYLPFLSHISQIKDIKDIKKLFASFFRSVQTVRAFQLKKVSRNTQLFYFPFYFHKMNEFCLHSSTATGSRNADKKIQEATSSSKPKLFFSSFLSKYKIYSFFLLIKKKLFFSLYSLYLLSKKQTDLTENLSPTDNLGELTNTSIKQGFDYFGVQSLQSHTPSFREREANKEIEKGKKKEKKRELWSDQESLFIEGSVFNKGKDSPIPLSYTIQNSLSRKKTKPLHLEISYKSLCAIFLYSPQRIYLPALLDMNLLVKAL